MMHQYCQLPRNTNQARGLAQYAIDFVQGCIGEPDEDVLRRVEQFHADSVGCAVAALAGGMNAPNVLRREAFDFQDSSGASCFGSSTRVAVEKAVLANSCAARELDANGTNFGYNPRTGNRRGEFGHNDFYPVAVAGAQIAKCDGLTTLRGMLCIDEIRGRLAEVFGLKDHNIDHVVHGGIASAAVFGALVGANADQIESAIGLLVAHHVPFRAIRAGHQLSDSKGASAAITAEMAVSCVRRAMRGFVGPADIFRNPQAIFCLFEPPDAGDTSPFDLELGVAGSDFAIMGMHFKLGLYEHQSAGAIQALLNLLSDQPQLLRDSNEIERIEIAIYEPAFGIIGDPAKRDPRTRHSADHSMLYIIGSLMKKAVQSGKASWRELMLLPSDYDDQALVDPNTRRWMERIDIRHGGPEFDARYPEGIPTQVCIRHPTLGDCDSGLVMYPLGHAQGPSESLVDLLRYKFRQLTLDAVEDVDQLWERFMNTDRLSVSDIATWYEFPLAPGDKETGRQGDGETRGRGDS